MIWIIVAVLALAAGLLGYLRERALIREHRLFVDALCKAAHEERRELLNRIQRPDHLPTGFVQDYHVPERVSDDWNKIGTIQIDDKFGYDEPPLELEH